MTGKRGVEKRSDKLANLPHRNDILRRLNADIEWLRAKMDTKKLIHPLRIKMFRASVYGYSVLLQGLKDEELELRIADLEEKLENGVILVDEQNQKAKRTGKLRGRGAF